MIVAVPCSPSDVKIAVAVPFRSVVTMVVIEPRVAVSRISVPGFRGLPSGWRPMTVMVGLAVQGDPGGIGADREDRARGGFRRGLVAAHERQQRQ